MSRSTVQGPPAERPRAVAGRIALRMIDRTPRANSSQEMPTLRSCPALRRFGTATKVLTFDPAQRSPNALTEPSSSAALSRHPIPAEEGP
jgi:hypothetical protein